MKRILLIQGHPDGSESHFGHLLTERYAAAAKSAGHAVTRVDLADLSFPLLRSKAEWENVSDLPAGLASAREQLLAANHVVLFFPLWLGEMPALVKGFLEQLVRPGTAIRSSGPRGWTGLMVGRSARVVVTMGMPAAIYRWYFFGHGLKSLRRNVLRFVGFAPVKQTIVGSVESSERSRLRGLRLMEVLGKRAA